MGKRLFGYDFVNLSFDVFIKTLPEELLKPKFQWCMTLNPEIVVGAQREPEIQSFIQQGICVADGMGLRLAYYAFHHKKLEKITGIDLVFRLLSEGRYSFYFVGATPAVMSQSVAIMRQTYPKSTLLGLHHGYFSEVEEAYLLQDICEKKPDFILVGLGFPKQEKFLEKLSKKATRGMGIGVGGVFDVLSGHKKKAPPFLRRCGLEWLFRGIIEPKRMKRWGFIPKFLWLFLTKGV